MLGAICTQDILLHPFVTVRAFGWGVFFRAVFAGQGDTFLSLLRRDGVFASPPAANELEIVERCVSLELQAAALYRSLAERFADSMALSEFLHELAAQEQQHADLLGVCAALARRGRFLSDPRPWHDYVPLLERQLQHAVASLDRIGSIDDVVQLILQVEGSEINRVFLGVVEVTDSPFVKRLGPFRRAVRRHIDYICKRISTLTPSAMLTCRELRARYLTPSARPR